MRKVLLATGYAVVYIDEDGKLINRRIAVYGDKPSAEDLIDSGNRNAVIVTATVYSKA